MARPYSSNRSGSAILDGAPPSPPEKILPKPSAPGADTQSLLGEQEMGGGMGGALREPGNKLLMAVAMFMQASNIADSVAPGFIPEEIKMWIAQSMEQAPAMAEQLARQGNPMQMLQAVGNSAAPGAAPMGLSAMGRGGMQPGAGAAGPPVLPGGGQY